MKPFNSTGGKLSVDLKSIISASYDLRFSVYRLLFTSRRLLDKVRRHCSLSARICDQKERGRPGDQSLQSVSRYSRLVSLKM